ncbi:cation diffusion facilitator family transporter [Neisseria sp. Ec49-e6-T10]|uniref:cation diffusion facilitator family transporter n=1 Tax=Neisseria sp. Ec49-e6-T10 TaxID=3140744 RepID=UPI003EB7EF01
MQKNLEQKLLKQSMLLMFIVAILGITIGFFSGSQSILFDGFFSIVATFIKILMVGTAVLIKRESSRTFQFGFWRLEPLVLIIEGSFILLISVYAFLNGIFGILDGGRQVEFGLAIGYAIFFTVADFSYFFYVKHKNRTLKSPLVHFDNISWLVDAMLSVGLLISFILAWQLSNHGLAQWSAYVDPIILIVLSLSMIPPSIKILHPSIKDLLGMAPDYLNEKVTETMEHFKQKYHFKEYASYVQKDGRAHVIEIHIVLAADFPINTVATLDNIRQEIADALGKANRQRWLTISFTGDKKWIV